MGSIYTLLLEGNKYYVGITNNLSKRLTQHFSGIGSAWTSMYKPIKHIETIENCDVFDEDKYTKIYMHKYGIDNVRGGSYSTVDLSSDVKKMLLKEFNTIDNKCFICERVGHFAKNCVMNDIQKLNHKLALIDERYSSIKQQLIIYQKRNTLTKELKTEINSLRRGKKSVALAKEFINDADNFVHGTIHKRSENRNGCRSQSDNNGKIWFIPESFNNSHFRSQNCPFDSPCGLHQCFCKNVTPVDYRYTDPNLCNPWGLALSLFNKHNVGSIFDINNFTQLEMYLMEDLNETLARLREIHDLEPKELLIQEGSKLIIEKNEILEFICKDYIE